MKTYEVELRRTSFVTLTVEANSAEEAEDKAWVALPDTVIHHDDLDADWQVESIEQLEEPV